MARGGAFWSIGDANSQSLGAVDYALAEAAMDPRDRPGAPVEPSSAKFARSYMPIPWEKERWDIGLPHELDEIMARRGVGIYPWAEVPTRLGMARLEVEFLARGIQWAPHKKRGPCRCIEFLGLLICNTEGLRGITITRKRRTKLIEAIEAWVALEPDEGDLTTDPRELASFLGKLVFVSQVVQGGRTYMQGMLSQFKGLVVDWQRGQVKPTAGKWQDLSATCDEVYARARGAASGLVHLRARRRRRRGQPLPGRQR